MGGSLSSEDFEKKLEGYTKKSEIDSYLSKINLSNLLSSNFATKDDLNIIKSSNFATKNDLNNYLTKNDLDSHNSYFSELEDNINEVKYSFNNYATVSDFDSYKNNYNTYTNNYVTLSNLDTYKNNLNSDYTTNYATTTDLDNYITKLDLDDYKNEFQNYVQNLESLDIYATKNDLNLYASNSDFDIYAKNASLLAVNSSLSNYATKTSLDSINSTVSKINLYNYVDKTDLVNNYASKTELVKYEPFIKTSLSYLLENPDKYDPTYKLLLPANTETKLTFWIESVFNLKPSGIICAGSYFIISSGTKDVLFSYTVAFDGSGGTKTAWIKYSKLNKTVNPYVFDSYVFALKSSVSNGNPTIITGSSSILMNNGDKVEIYAKSNDSSSYVLPGSYESRYQTSVIVSYI